MCRPSVGKNREKQISTVIRNLPQPSSTFRYFNNYLRTDCDKTFFAHERIIRGTSHEGASASFARMCRIRPRASKFVQFFLNEHYV
jgi:hypothetical protein